MKRYTVTFIIKKELDKVLMIYKYWGPYPNKYNGVGGHIEENEDVVTSAIREAKEETAKELTIDEIKYLMTITFPYEVELNVFYAVCEQFEVNDSNEGILRWLPIEFALDFNNQYMAGDGNVAYFIREALRIIRG